ncbi:MAG TPA: RES family NAD+ phosphorylase [Steroidobacteraceae bacterium]|nr:RES family NAD+ phosphorylase [Steroidobacteraceae bacterium]
MRVFRIAAARFAASRKKAFSGAGGIRASARWHSAGHPIVYTAQSLSLAALEILVHLKQTDDLRPFRAYIVSIPDELISQPRRYPLRWRTEYRVSRAFGNAWLEAGNKPVLRVPSVITPGEWNYLLNPLHPAFSLKWVVSGPTVYAFDIRLLSARGSSH